MIDLSSMHFASTRSSKYPWRALALALALALPSQAAVPVVQVTKLLDDSSGGSFTLAQVGVVDGKKVFLKSNRGSMRGTRYSNFESDILARAIFKKLGIRCPDARVVRLGPGGPTSKWMGSVVLAMQYVDTRFTRGKVLMGHWPGARYARLAEFIDLALVDLIIGNGDRRGANFFVMVDYDDVEGERGKPGSFRPVPIDNNCGFASMVVWSFPTSQTNFLPTYSGVGKGEVLCDLGTLKNIALDSEVLHALLGDARMRPRLLARARELGAILTDEFFGAQVDALPAEILPRAIKVDASILDKMTKRDFEPSALFGPMTGTLEGKALFDYRKAELKRVFAWRRDHLAEALEQYFQTNPPEKPEGD